MDSSEEIDYEVIKTSTSKKNIYIVKDASSLVYVKNNIARSNDTVRLVLKSLDKELIDLLIGLDAHFEIVYELKEQSYSPFELLKVFMEATGNKVYVNYNIDNKTDFDRVLIDYYIYYYGVTMLLDTKDRLLYNEWVQELTKHVEKKSVKKLNKKYVGEKA